MASFDPFQVLRKSFTLLVQQLDAPHMAHGDPRLSQPQGSSDHGNARLVTKACTLVIPFNFIYRT